MVQHIKSPQEENKESQLHYNRAGQNYNYKTAKQTLSDSFVVYRLSALLLLRLCSAAIAGNIDGSKHSADSGIRPRPLMLSDWTKRQHLSCCYPESRRWFACKGCQSIISLYPLSFVEAFFHTWQRTAHMYLCFDFEMGDGNRTTGRLFVSNDDNVVIKEHFFKQI